MCRLARQDAGTSVSAAEPFPISPADFAASELFERTFKEGMDLVDEAAVYLEGPGRDSARALTRDGALAYAAESMRLTTRLMQIASWLLVHRAVRDGEMSSEEARGERYRFTKESEPRAIVVQGLGELPSRLMDLSSRCERLYARVTRLDERLFTVPARANEPNPVGRELAKLEAALRARGLAGGWGE